MMMVMMFMFVVMVLMPVFVVMVLVPVLMSMGLLLRISLLTESVEFCGQSLFLLHSLQNLCTCNLIPRRRNNGGVPVMLSQKSDAGVQFLLGKSVHMTQNDRARVLHLIVEELTEVLHIHLAFLRIHNSRETVQLNLIIMQILHGNNHVAEFSNARRLDQYPIRGKLLDDLIQRPSEIAYQTTADAARVHLIDLHSSILQKSAVYADFAEFVLNQNDLLVTIRLFNQFFDQRRFSGSKKTGENIYFCHKKIISFR